MPILILILMLIILHTSSNCYAEGTPKQNKSTFFKGIWSREIEPKACNSSLDLANEEQTYWYRHKELVSQKLYPLWETLPKGPLKDIIVGYKFTRAGELIESHVLASTGAQDLDEAYLIAFRQSFPHPAIPGSIFFDENLLYILSPSRVKFHLDYNSKEKRDQFAVESNAKLKEWVENSQIIVRKNWELEEVNGIKNSKQITVWSDVELKTGKILNTRIIESSCETYLDQTAIKAIEKSNPLPPLSNTDFPLDVVRLQWVLSYETWSNNRSK